MQPEDVTRWVYGEDSTDLVTWEERFASGFEASMDRGRMDNGFQIVNLWALVLMRSTLYRPKDRVRILDLIGVGLIAAEASRRQLSVPLGERLQRLLDDPNG